MYEIEIQKVFHATHALKLYDGTMEEPHAHDWHTWVVVQADSLDPIEVVMDFHELENIVEGVIKPLQNTDLNKVALLDGFNPSAERIVERIYLAIEPQLPEQVQLVSVTVTEAPGCKATYRANA